MCLVGLCYPKSAMDAVDNQGCEGDNDEAKKRAFSMLELSSKLLKAASIEKPLSHSTPQLI